MQITTKREKENRAYLRIKWLTILFSEVYMGAWACVLRRTERIKSTLRNSVL